MRRRCHASRCRNPDMPSAVPAARDEPCSTSSATTPPAVLSIARFVQPAPRTPYRSDAAQPGGESRPMSIRMIQGTVALAAWMLVMPAAAQQAQAPDPHHPAGGALAAGPSAAQTAPVAPTPAPPGGMGMMGGQGGMGMMGMMGGDERQPGMSMMRRHGPYATPMNVIINVGPDIRLDVEGPGATGGMPPRVWSSQRDSYSNSSVIESSNALASSSKPTCVPSQRE